MTTSNNYRSGIMPTWCPGCHNFLAFAQIQRVLAANNIESHDLVFCYDIGCSGNMADFLKTYGFHTLHGRATSTAMGVKMANPKLNVLVYGGDGGTYGEGLNHLVAAARANIDIKVIVSNNYLYSLTTGQTSPTTPQCAKTKSTPLGNPNLPLDPIKLIKSVNPEVFAKNVTATDAPALTKAFDELFAHKGFGLLDISMVCLAFGKQLSP